MIAPINLYRLGLTLNRSYMDAVNLESKDTLTLARWTLHLLLWISYLILIIPSTILFEEKVCFGSRAQWRQILKIKQI